MNKCLCLRSTRISSPAGLTVTALVTVLYLTGCASVPEKTLRNRYSETHHNFYEATGGSDLFDRDSSLDDFLKYAFSHSPVLRAAFDRWQGAMERIPQARSLDDPSLSFEYFVEQRNQRYQLSLTQMFPAFGKVGLRDQRAVAEAEAAMHEFEEKRLVLYDSVVKAFYEYHYLSRAIDVTDENLRLLSDVEHVLTTRYTSGLTPFAELIKVQLEKDRLANELVSLRDERGPKSALLSALLNLPAHDVLPWPKAAPSAQSAIDEAVLAGMIEDLNPELKAADSMIAAEEYRGKLARKSFLPDFSLGVNWMVMPGSDGTGDISDVSLMAGVSLPLWRSKF